MRLRGSGIEEGGRGMGEVFLGHEIVCFNYFLNVLAVDTDRNSHYHMLWPFGNLAVGS